MGVSIKVLFGKPQQEVASLMRARIEDCVSFSMVSGFATVGGVERIAGPILNDPNKLAGLVVGAGTFSAYEAFDKLLAGGVMPDRLYVHLGMTRQRGATPAVFQRYHPMLHSKVCLLDMGSGHSAAFVGSHNLTVFALGGLNGEAGLLLEGESADPVFADLRQHIAECVAQARQYDSTMKDAYAWWARDLFDGMGIEANDGPTDAEARRTVIILAALKGRALPAADETIYFEIPEALGELQALNTDVHVYLFDALPSSPGLALGQLKSARAALACKTSATLKKQIASEVVAEWNIDNRMNPILLRTQPPFKPGKSRGMQQVCVEVTTPLKGDFEYLFDRGRKSWAPELDRTKRLETEFATDERFRPIDRRRAEEGEWFAVDNLTPADKKESHSLMQALKDSASDSGSFILLSPRRRRGTGPT